MSATGQQGRFTKLHIATLLGLLALSAVNFQAQAAEQPKPGPEHKKMEVAVGQWNYEGSAEASPFGPAGRFKGRETARMVLGGFFLESQEQDKGDSKYDLQTLRIPSA